VATRPNEGVLCDVASKRFSRKVRVVIVATFTVALGVPLVPASAQPPAPSDPQAEYQQLVEQAAQADEDLLDAQEDVAVNRAGLERARQDLAAAQDAGRRAADEMEQFRGQVDQLADASFRGATFSKMSALLTGESTQDFLDRASALELLAGDHYRTLDRFADAAAAAEQARSQSETATQQAAGATAAAEKLAADIEQRKTELDAKIRQLRDARARLSPDARADMGRVKDNGIYFGPPGAANTALQAALSRKGSEYQWGAEGPNEFDCSGLTMWAYNLAGIKLPHSSRSQYTMGRAVSTNELQPGDLLFYDDGTGNPDRIHHVGMYVGDGKIVDAPTEGQLVDVRGMRSDGHYIGARRLAG